MSELASKFSDRHANEIKAEGKTILLAENFADYCDRVLTNRRSLQEIDQRTLITVLRNVCGVARDYHLSAAELVD